MNILQSLADQAKKKKDELVQNIGNIGAAPHPVQINSPQALQKIQTAKYGVLAQGNNRNVAVNQLNNAQAASKPTVATGLNNAMDAFNNSTAQAGRFVVQNGITKPGMEIAQSIRQQVTHKPSSYTPTSGAAKAIFGDAPIQSLQANNATTRSGLQHSSNPVVQALATPLSYANTALHVANDVPVVGAAVKYGTKAAAKGAPLAVRAAENIAPRAVPALQATAQGLKAASQTLDRGAVATTKAIGGQIQASSAKKSLVASSKASIQDLNKQKAMLQQRIAKSPINAYGGVETTQRHIDQIDGRINQIQANAPKLSLKDRILAPDIGLGTKPVKTLDESEANKIRLAIEAQKKAGTIKPDDPNYWSTPIKNQPKAKMPDVKDTNGVQPKEGDVIEFGGVLGGKGQATVHWQEPHIANATGERVEGRWIGNGDISNTKLPFTIVKRADTPTAPASPAKKPLPPQSDAALPQRPQLPKKQPVVQSEVSLPEYGTKQVKGIDKAFRSTRSIIERQGEHGKQLAGMLQASRDAEEIHQAQIQKALPTVRSLKGKDFENFVEATQGKIAPANPKIAQAVQEWQAIHPTIRDRAVAAGLDVGDLGPNYYPHVIDYQKLFKDKNQKNAAINHLVQTGQAKTPEEALQLLSHAKDVSRNREFGNLEAQRLVDLPMYDKTPNSLVSYIGGSTKRIAQTETFGAKDEKALELITKAAGQGYDTAAMKDAYDVAVGAKRYGETATNFSNKARAFQSTTRLGLGALTNTSQNVNTGIVTGHLNTLGAMAKQLNPKTRSFVADTGVIADAVMNDIKTASGFTGKVLGKITAPGFAKVETFNRSVAATAGRDYALRLAQKGDEATLRKLGVTGAIEGKTLSEAQQIQAARKVVEKTQFKVDAQDLPGWADSPGGKLVSQFRTFSYAQGKFVSNEILKPLAKGNVKPAARLLASLPLGYGLYETKRVINGRPEEENKTKRGLATFQNVGGAGLAFDIYQSLNPTNSQYLPADRRVTMGVGTIGGPTAGLAASAIGAVNDLIQRKNTPDDASRLDGKVAIGNNGSTYTDATQAARFGLNQIPIIGGPIRNRVLPYKAQAQADAGTGKGSTGTASLDTSKTSGGNGSTQTPELQAFLKLKEADQKALAASDPNARALYDQQQAIKKGTAASPLRPVGLDPQAAKVLDKYDHMLPQAKDKVFARNKTAEYEYETARYMSDKAAGNLSTTEDIRRQQELAKSQVGSEFDKEVRDIYGLNKTQVYKYITTNKNGKDLADKLIAYGDSLEGNDLGDNKFRDSKGNIAFAPKAKGGGSGSGKSLSTLLAEFKLPGTENVRNRSKAASLARSAGLAKRRG